MAKGTGGRSDLSHRHIPTLLVTRGLLASVPLSMCTDLAARMSFHVLDTPPPVKTISCFCTSVPCLYRPEQLGRH